LYLNGDGALNGAVGQKGLKVTQIIKIGRKIDGFPTWILNSLLYI
jgi:hypothetical protein